MNSHPWAEREPGGAAGFTQLPTEKHVDNFGLIFLGGEINGMTCSLSLSHLADEIHCTAQRPLHHYRTFLRPPLPRPSLERTLRAVSAEDGGLGLRAEGFLR